MRSAHHVQLLAALVCALVSGGCGFGEQTNILILARADDPISQSIAEYYAAARQIPANRILSLQLSPSDPPGDTVSEIDAATFEREIAGPIESYLANHDPDGEISTLITTTGIPLRIGHCKPTQSHYPRDCASATVDAALAALGRVPIGMGPSQANTNPYFGDPRSFEAFRRDEPDARLRFLVARLTGPSTPLHPGSRIPAALQDLIDRSTASEPRDSASPPRWRILADAPKSDRSAASAALFNPIGERLAHSGHLICDGCSAPSEFRTPAGLVLQSGLDAPIQNEPLERLGFPGVVIALGDSAGRVDPRDRGAERFDQNVARWLDRGARALSTHLGDPSLVGVTRPDIQLQAWAEGRTAVEAHFRSVPHLGWVNVFIGDPLLALESPEYSPDNDRDGDGVVDEQDNCLDVSNVEQRDSNHDRLGNRCDPDVDNDGQVETSWGQIYPLDARGDLEAIALTARNGPHNPDHDLDGDGRVDASDLALAQLWLFRTPGPTGYDLGGLRESR
jgi:hypothetical protein